MIDTQVTVVDILNHIIKKYDSCYLNPVCMFHTDRG